MACDGCVCVGVKSRREEDFRVGGWNRVDTGFLNKDERVVIGLTPGLEAGPVGSFDKTTSLSPEGGVKRVTSNLGLEPYPLGRSSEKKLRRWNRGPMGNLRECRNTNERIVMNY